MTVLSSNQALTSRPSFLIRWWYALKSWNEARRNPPVTNQRQLRAAINKQRGCEHGCNCTACDQLFFDINRFES